MSKRLREETDIRTSEFDDYEYSHYKDLKRQRIKVRVSDSVYTCPYCDGNRDYDLKELLQHASRLAKESQRRSLKEQARHLALKSYVERYLDAKERPRDCSKREAPVVRSLKREAPVVCCSKREAPIVERYLDAKERPRDFSKKEALVVRSTKRESPTREAPVVRSPRKESFKSEDPVVTSPKRESPTREALVAHNREKEQLFVWPWMGIVANIETKLVDGRSVGESGTKLKDELAMKGFDPVKVHPLWSRFGHSGCAIVEFKKDWDGFNNAIMFEKDFELKHCGKKEYLRTPERRRGQELYGWIARDDDYNAKSLIGDHLRKNGDLKSVSEKEAEDQRKNSKLVSSLTNTLKMKHDCLKEMVSRYDETSASLDKVINQKDEMVKSYNEEIKTMQQNTHEHFEKISIEHEKTTQQLLAKRKELEQREKELQRRAVQNENERSKLHHEKKMNERATLEQKKADESVLRLAEEQKKEKEELRKKIIELEKQLDAKQALELEIECMKNSLQVMKHMGEDEDLEVKNKMDTIREELKEKEEELDGLGELNQALIVKERESNDELQDARKELIGYLGEFKSRAFIGVKRMGDLNEKPFHEAAKRKFSDEEADEKALELCSLWEDRLRDPSWHPFKIITDKEGNSKEIIDEDDENLNGLKSEYGDEVFNAVIVALKEMNEYNPSGRYIIRELWNFKETRKASLTEGIVHILKQWKLLKRRRT